MPIEDESLERQLMYYENLLAQLEQDGPALIELYKPMFEAEVIRINEQIAAQE